MDEGLSVKELTNFLPKTISQIYGEAASGKTNICMLAAIECAKSGKRAVFIDSEGSFSTERFKQLTKSDTQELLKSILIAEPADFDEQKIAIGKIQDLCIDGNVGLVIVDSLVSLYRLEMSSGEDAYRTNRELSRQLALLSKIARKYKIPVIVTNQVYSSFTKGDSKDNKSEVVPVGRDVLKYWTKTTIKLEKEGTSRRATLTRHPTKKEGASCIFKITNDGLENESFIDSCPE